MANRLLATCDSPCVGTRWAYNFINRHAELKTRFQRKYDYQRARCEDPSVISSWFELVHNTIVKYGINDADIYNFNETRFMMGVISTAMVVTSLEGCTNAIRIQPGNLEWVTVIEGSILQVGQYRHLSLLRVKTILPHGTKTADSHKIRLLQLLRMVRQQMRKVWVGFNTLRNTQNIKVLVVIAC